MKTSLPETAGIAEIRIDKWLLAARFFKTRQLAIDALGAGRISVNGQRVKPAKTIRCHDCLTIRKPPYEWHVVITGIADKRGSATVAATLYRETVENQAARQALLDERRSQPPSLFPGRPTKRDRRLIDKLRHASLDESA